MGLWRWIEKKFWLGEIIKDYGVIQEKKVGPACSKISAMLCQKNGELKFIIKESNTAFLAASVRYLEITSSNVHKFKDILQDAEREMQALQ
ncbi:MAG: hypothetical protein D6732_03060 [Methanobacteriota archaeon]|nr:MAG: hypothetical protein D6732_03060 [Euryarchaeota archaeon]